MEEDVLDPYSDDEGTNNKSKKEDADRNKTYNHF